MDEVCLVGIRTNEIEKPIFEGFKQEYADKAGHGEKTESLFVPSARSYCRMNGKITGNGKEADH